MAGITLNVLGNFRDFIRGTENAEEALDDVADSLDDMARDGDKAAEKLERSFRDLAEQAKDSGKDAGRDFEKGMSKGLQEVKEEAHQSGREAAASFSGEFEDVTDYVQEVVAQGLGPAGIAGAALIGAITAVATAAVDEWNQKIDEIKQATADMWAEAAEEGRKFLSEDALQAETHRIFWDEAYRKDLDAFEKAGISRYEAARALAEGEGAVYDSVVERQQKYIDGLGQEQTQHMLVNETIDGGIALRQAEGQAALDTLKEKGRATERSKQYAKEEADAVAESEARKRDQIKQTQDRLDSLNSTPLPTKTLTVRAVVDDSDVRNYTPRAKNMLVRAHVNQAV